MKTFNYLKNTEDSFHKILANLKAEQSIDMDDKKLSKKDKDKINKSIKALTVAATEGAAMYEAATRAKGADITDADLASLVSTLDK